MEGNLMTRRDLILLYHFDKKPTKNYEILCDDLSSMFSNRRLNSIPTAMNSKKHYDNQYRYFMKNEIV